LYSKYNNMKCREHGIKIDRIFKDKI